MSRHGDGSGHSRAGAGTTASERAWRQERPTFSFAGHEHRRWPKLLSTVTAVGARINTSGDPESFRMFADFFDGGVSESALSVIWCPL